MNSFHKLALVGALAFATLTVGCTPEEEIDECEGKSFAQPDNTVVVNFTIDASGRPGFYADEQIQWKGSFQYDAETRVIVKDTNWASPWPPLYDDGPWTCGGHEPDGATAGDDKFGITVFFAKPETATELEYGLRDAVAGGSNNDAGWIWVGPNGKVTINPTDTEVTAEGLTLSPEGAVDFRLTLDTTALGSGFTEGGKNIKVKGTYSGWAETVAYDDASHGDAVANDHIYTFTLSANDPKLLKLTSGTTVEWVWVINSVEYKTNGGQAEKTGVKAFTNKSAAGWVDQTANIAITTGQFPNTYITVP